MKKIFYLYFVIFNFFFQKILSLNEKSNQNISEETNFEQNFNEYSPFLNQIISPNFSSNISAKDVNLIENSLNISETNNLFTEKLSDEYQENNSENEKEDEAEISNQVFELRKNFRKPAQFHIGMEKIKN